MDPLPDTPTQAAARIAYREACERMADASVALHVARKEHEAAMAQYNKAWGAARQAGVVK